ncbi:uncharacterized protein BDW43DRAFT_317217 [Aspergillus alliaceus]|uniref:uncharacterized protein n=1 Tax=Petromyces alliaceus TaxID=209559 RepID=UPI0012A68A30|nr:uncharacterized protein BDW43DRAFT_317217 [Aspergillus alliaceus]KAB8227026.1 hypothetical protein BDW43DRAFT_317217 [Aspergillus alliaceus]
MTLDDISAFDTLPYCPEGSDDAELVKDAEHAFSQMVKLKAPDVVLCSYRSPSNESLAQELRSIGVGKAFAEPKLRITDDCTTMRLNAFHPSYVVHYQQSYSCFRSTSPGICESFFSSINGMGGRRMDEQIALTPRWPTIDENRWIAILTAIQRNFSNLDYFRSKLDSDIFLEMLVGDNLSWNCADASLFLAEIREKYAESPNNGRISQLLLSHFETWFTISTIPQTPRKNYRSSDPRGYYELQYLSKGANTPRHMAPLYDIFFSFLKDLNLSFSRDETGELLSNLSAQQNAFLRFSTNLEKAAGRRVPLLTKSFTMWRTNNSKDFIEGALGYTFEGRHIIEEAMQRNRNKRLVLLGDKAVALVFVDSQYRHAVEAARMGITNLLQKYAPNEEVTLMDVFNQVRCTHLAAIHLFTLLPLVLKLF